MKKHKKIVQLLEQLNEKMDKFMYLAIQSQFSYEVLKCHPNVLQLSIKDLSDLYAEQVQLLHRFGVSHRTYQPVTNSPVGYAENGKLHLTISVDEKEIHHVY